MMDTDRNLLLGALAFHNDYIDLAQFAAVCGVWAADKSTPLAQLLVEKGWIDAQARHELERLADRKLKRYGGNVRATLGVVADGALRDVIRRVDDDEVRRSINDLPAAAGHVLVATLVKPTEARTRYTLTRMHAEGGLGKIWVARDVDLNREVALKELKPEQAAHPDAWRRFFKEAQIAGQLEHPNIVPVYELARRSEDDQPFYTMRLVHGQTLRDAIAQYHQDIREGKQDPLGLLRLLGAFVSVCHATGYAHSRSVVHRDLKPENVVLGSFGEVILLDWGLAKVLGESEADRSEERPSVAISEAACTEATTAGRVLGTPAYMAPEQAEGRLELIDARTDIYGLGAILYEILTGRPPHDGSGTAETLRRIIAGDSPRPRSVRSAVPAALNAICAKAMAKPRAERYPSASDLADDVQRFLADQPVSVYCEPWHQRLGRWARRHRTWTQAAAAVLVLCTVVSLVAAFLVNGARQNEAKARAAESTARAAATYRLKQLREAVDTLLTGVSEGLQDVAGAQKIRLSLIEKASETYAELAYAQSGDPKLQLEAAWAQFRLGQIHELLGRPETAQQLLQEAKNSFAKLLADSSLPSEECYDGIAASQSQLGVVLTRLGRTREADAAHQMAITELEKLDRSDHSQPRHRDQLGRALANLGQLQLMSGHLHEAADSLSKAALVFRKQADSLPDDLENGYALASTRSSLGQVQGAAGQNYQAVTSFRAAAADFEQLLQRAPAVPRFLEGLANSRVSLANELCSLGLCQDADQLYRQAICEYQTLVELEPGLSRYRAGLAQALANRGMVLDSLGRAREAVRVLQEAFDQYRRLMDAEPQMIEHREAMAHVRVALAQTLGSAARNADAEGHCQSAIAEYEALLGKTPEAVGYRHCLAVARGTLGFWFHKQGRIFEAEDAYSSTIAELTKLMHEHRDVPSYRDDLAGALARQGELLNSAQRLPEAEQVYRQALAIREELAREFPSQPEYAHRLAWLLVTCPVHQLRDPARALANAQRACDIALDNGSYWVTLGASHLRAGHSQEAISALQKGLQVRQTGDAAGWLFLTMASLQVHDIAAAETCFQHAIDGMARNKPEDPELLRFRQEAEQMLGITRARDAATRDH